MDPKKAPAHFMRGTATEVWGKDNYETMRGSAAVWNREERLLSSGFSFVVFLNFTLLRRNKLNMVSEDSNQLLKLKHDTTTMYDSAMHKALR